MYNSSSNPLQANPSFSQLYNSLCQMYTHLSTVTPDLRYPTLVRANHVAQINELLLVILVRMNRLANMMNIWVELDGVTEHDRAVMTCDRRRRYRTCRRLRDFILLEHTSVVVRQLEQYARDLLQ